MEDLGPELDPKRGLMLTLEPAFHEPEQQAALPHI